MTDLRSPEPRVPHLRTVVVATDFSPTSELAVDYGCDLAATFDGTVHLLHVVENPRLGPGSAEIWGFSLPALVERLERSAETRLASMVSDRASAAPIVPVARVGEPFVEIVRYAREQQADLLVLGTHGRGPIAHMFLGSVAEKVVRTAPCPVLTVRPPDHTFTMI